MEFKAILMLLCVILALVCTIIIMGSIIRGKNRKITSLSESLKRQRDILAKIDGIKQTAKKEQKIISTGSAAERFSNSIKILRKHKKNYDQEDSE